MTPAAGWPVARLRWLVAAQTLCVAAILVAGQVTSGRAAAADQAPWVSLAVAAAVGSGAGNGLWLLHLRRATGVRSRDLLARMAAEAETFDAVGGGGFERIAASHDAGDRVVVPGMTLVHRPGCLLVAGKRTEPAGREFGEREPCGWCGP